MKFVTLTNGEMDLITFAFGQTVDHKRIQPIDVQRALKHATLNAPTAPCGCPACDNHVQQGHFVCSSAPQWALEAERAGVIARYYDGTSWKWEAAS